MDRRQIVLGELITTAHILKSLIELEISQSDLDSFNLQLSLCQEVPPLAATNRCLPIQELYNRLVLLLQRARIRPALQRQNANQF